MIWKFNFYRKNCATTNILLSNRIEINNSNLYKKICGAKRKYVTFINMLYTQIFSKFHEK